MQARTQAFTLIELLVVVGILGLLAAVAVPNFLEAQVRSKISRVKVDLAATAHATACYRLDWGNYPPNDGLFNNLPLELSTPVAYLTSVHLVDPFCKQEDHPVHGERARFYTYTEIVSLNMAMSRLGIGRPVPYEAIDHAFYNEGAFEKYGRWRLASNGPDKRYTVLDYDETTDPTTSDVQLQGIDLPYDPTNGTLSPGNILRTQLSPEGRIESPRSDD